MTLPAPRHRYTFKDYLDLEEVAGVRHEFFDGEIYAMAGGSPDHAALAAAIIGILRAGLPRGCRAFTSDLRIRVMSTGLSTYPDAAIVCGRSLRAADDPIAVTNPVLLVEVTSPSTEDYDRGEKLRQYRTIPSVREILVVSHRQPELTLHRRGEADWRTLVVGPGESVELASVGVQIAVDDVYRDGLEDA